MATLLDVQDLDTYQCHDTILLQHTGRNAIHKVSHHEMTGQEQAVFIYCHLNFELN